MFSVPKPRLYFQASALLFSLMVSPNVFSEQDGKPPAVPVEVVEVSRSDVPIHFEYPGRVQAVQHVEVQAQVKGVLEQKFYEDGEAVEAGQLLYQIDSRRYRALVNKAQAEVEVATASLNQAQREYSRVSGLYKNKAVSEQELDKALSNLELAKAGLQGAQAALKDAQIDLEYAQVRAEISGITGLKQQDVGNLVGSQPGNSLLTTITQLDPVHVIYGMSDSDRQRLRSETLAGKLKITQPKQAQAEIVDSEGRVVVRGYVDFVSTQVDHTTGSLRARARFDNPEHRLLPGEFVRIRVHGTSRAQVFSVPQKSVMQIGQQAFVYVVKEGVVDLYPVVLSEQVDGQWLIESGLQSGDQVVISNLIKLRPKTPVQVMRGDQEGENAQGQSAL
jgi:membrane fusion protein (multidrug efflux system)